MHTEDFKNTTIFALTKKRSYLVLNEEERKQSEYLDIFDVHINGWIPLDGHVVIIINNCLQITNFTKVSTYQH